MAFVEKIESVFDVNTTTAGVQFTPAVTALDNGGFAVAWNFVDSSIVGQLYDFQGFRSGGEFVLSTANALQQFAPDLATLSDGTFVAVWGHEFSATDIDVRGRRFGEDGAGLTDDFPIAVTGLRDETLPSITAQLDGRYLVTWSQDDNQVNFVQKNADGGTVSGPGPIDAAPPGAPERFSSVTALVDGTYVVAFEQGTEVFQRQLVANAVATRVENPGFGVADRPSIAALEGGGYVVVFRHGGAAGDSARPLVSGQIYDQFGNKVGGGFNPVTLSSAVDQTTPVVKGLVGGGFIVVWDDAALGLRALAYDARGQTVGDLMQLTPAGQGGSFGNLDVTQTRDGDVVVVWGGNAGVDDVGIDGQVLRVFNVQQGTSGNDQLATQLNGAVSRLNPGFQANDHIFGLAGDDVLQGRGGVRDILDGGGGSDTSSYIDAPSSVTANLAVPRFSNGEAIGDEYISIENLEGSFFNDQLTGNDLANKLDGVDGDDFLEGLAGDDTLVGNIGNDELDGGDGADVLNGQAGDDILRGGPGGDRFVFGPSPAELGRDVIADFALPDRIDVSAIDANAGAGGDQAFAFIGDAAFTAPGQLRAVSGGAGTTLVEGNVDGAPNADFQIELTGSLALAGADFVL